ncbi:fucolectin-like isoform X2 [Paramisgurnus dabryanus]|uniref:fucolectin-like isoform X2 n=1 Tax=Paramisgurnus dabryanus TaxID=90735 RepID=UPI003CCF928D
MWMFSCFCVLFVNLARRGQTVQSSTGMVGWEADKAIDTSPLTCTHTVATTDNPWWRVDLLDSYYISRVVVTNRPDYGPERLDGAEIRIGNSLANNGNNNTRCAVLYGLPMGQSISVTCDDILGRYLTIIIPGSSKILTVCDVQVYQKVQKSFMKMNFTSILDMSDPTERNNVLKELKTALTSKGLSNFTLTWKNIPQKVQLKTSLNGKSMC